MTDLDLLLQHLRLARQTSYPFSEAWPVALEAPLRATPPEERLDWVRALIATRTA